MALPEAFWFKHAQVALQAGSYADAVESVTRYLTTAGREGAHYREALELLDQATVAAEVEQRLAQLPREVRNSIGMEFVLIEPGTFEMGSPETEAGRDGDETLHTVTFSQPFYLGKYEVTQRAVGCGDGGQSVTFRRLWQNVPGRECILGGRAGVHREAEPAGGNERVPAADGSGVGVCGPGARADGGLLV